MYEIRGEDIEWWSSTIKNTPTLYWTIVATYLQFPSELSGLQTIKEKSSIIIGGAGGAEEYLHFVIISPKLSDSCYKYNRFPWKLNLRMRILIATWFNLIKDVCMELLLFLSNVFHGGFITVIPMRFQIIKTRQFPFLSVQFPDPWDLGRCEASCVVTLLLHCGEIRGWMEIFYSSELVIKN